MAELQTNGGREATSLLSQVTNGAYVDVLTSPVAKDLVTKFIRRLEAQAAGENNNAPPEPSQDSLSEDEIAVGLAALNAFLQANVTGPVLEQVGKVEALFVEASAAAPSGAADTLKELRKSSFGALEIDGVSPYPYIPNIELFALARHIFTESASASGAVIKLSSSRLSLPWTRLRINVWHFKLLSQPSLGPGSNFAKSSQWIDVPTLAEQINFGMEAVRKQILDEDVWSTSEDSTWSREEKVQFLLEAANTHIMLGRDDRAREALKEATELNRFAYALSGALGKRTKFQEKSTSQLVVLAKSDTPTESAEENGDAEAKPEAVALNDDTLLEEIQFSKEASGKHGELAATSAGLPATLVDLSPDAQPQLSPLDQIILLTEATLKDTFSPVDSLTSEEVLPYAVRVVSDKATNWQIYTQALLVRSRIEVHRSRTVERGVLQMQAVVDQVVVDTSEAPRPRAEDVAHEPELPAIAVTAPGETDKPTSFFPAAKETDTAPAHVRLQYIHALSSPPRWHLESELAYSWAGVGSLVSALEIFKRLRLWAEVALCLASSASADDNSGRGSGGEDKAKALVRWRLFHRTGQPVVENADPDAEDVALRDVTYLDPADFAGPERSPPPPNAPRLFCILGDLENEPAHWERAWDISKHRFARAQKSLGEWYLAHKDWAKAQDAYKLATKCNRLSPEMWSRLGDISLRLGQFADAAEAYSRAIGAAGDVVGGEDARTWSNLGSALWSMYLEAVEELKKQIIEEKKTGVKKSEDDGDDADDEEPKQRDPKPRDPGALLSQALAAYKRGASIAQDNWRIWDNVLTLASRMRPPAIVDMVQALGTIIRIRKTEDALDDAVLRALLQEGVLSKAKEDNKSGGVYAPPRGTVEKAVTALFEEAIVPLITTRSELWELVVRLRVWRRDYAGAVDAAEKAWRAAMGAGAGGGLAASAAASGGADQSRNWLVDAGAWAAVVARTDELVSVLENFGGEVEGVGSKWRGKARNAVRSVMSRGREAWEGTEEWNQLEVMMEGLKL
ncbi:TPR repeat-containing protein [Colletotrichum graminicola]|uniref:TPR repeat-containing protein n=1 Tax=Colletotrichum graminicola (strain M1.001 / M2 / FGSC 10212) TaxID=645133 RepID=E3QSZ8_COLGM|nr:TPR repeat-containing protein [Colletotrichum graminicola M1.001]EFQ33986.1 TPR repeat-containing protein [Colletotrichum graminicola M1.001]WDK21185.1 TPR repeat-containing protein [Colletotrichum graminicola]